MEGKSQTGWFHVESSWLKIGGCYQILGTGWEGRKGPPRYSGISSPPSPLFPLRPGLEAKRNVTGPPRLHQLGPDQSRKQFPRPPSSQGQQACPDLGQAPAALGFVSSCLEASRGHLILPLALSKRPSRQGSASPALLLLSSSSHSLRLSFPLVLSLASPTAIFRPGLLVLSPHFLEI